MRRIVFLITIIVTLTSCQSSEDVQALLEDNLSKEKSEYQQQIVGHLSGEYELANNITMGIRWSKEERKLAERYLKELLLQLNIEPQEQHYMSPNLNPAIDLIVGPFQGSNVYGILPATQSSNEYIILGAHYDTGKRNAPGAIDNATGIALIYSVAQEVAEMKSRDKNIVLVFFDQEEEELIGSRAFLDLIKEKQWNVHSIHCFDMVGWDENQDKAMEIFSPSESLRSIYKETAAAHNIPIHEIVIDPIGYEVSSTDFDAFVPGGYSVIGAGELFYHRDSTPYKDSPKDTFETVDFSYLLSSSNLVAEIIKKLVL
ncbi:M20/M25/M40 family metallo-hydrolase [Gracilimonas sp.]|uniref:M28 family metallopeptidase n=1 Tax=Gracilimonas sp. TaxID=1974203 RepID=UPI0032EC0EB5